MLITYWPHCIKFLKDWPGKLLVVWTFICLLFFPSDLFIQHLEVAHVQCLDPRACHMSELIWVPYYCYGFRWSQATGLGVPQQIKVTWPDLFREICWSLQELHAKRKWHMSARHWEHKRMKIGRWDEVVLYRLSVEFSGNTTGSSNCRGFVLLFCGIRWQRNGII